MVVEGRDGTKTVTGGMALKSTQAYPRIFGDAVARVHCQNRHLCLAEDVVWSDCGELTFEQFCEGSDDGWSADANLAPVVELLKSIIVHKLDVQ